MSARLNGIEGERGSVLPTPGVVGAETLHTGPRSRTESRPHAADGQLVAHEALAAAIVVGLAATVAIVPMLVFGPVSGHDFSFHIASWMDVARQWHQGTIYPQWAEFANWGFGEPRFVFYPPASWMLGAALGSLFAWKIVPAVFVWLVLIAAGLSMFLLARESLPQRQAILIAGLFAANPYHLLLIYYRCDFAELLASVFFPLLPLGVMWVAREGWRRVPVLALVVACIWLSNAPAAVIAVYSLVFLFLVAYLLQRDLRLLVYGAAATASGFGLAAFYILPAARERAWVQINEVLTDGLRPEQNFLFTRASSMVVNTDFNVKISFVIVLMAVLAGAASYHLAKTSRIPRIQLALLVALGAMSFFMMWPLSRPFWLLAPELHFIQFPWRYALPFAVAFAFLVGTAASSSKKLSLVAVGVFIFAGPMAKMLLAVERPSSWKKPQMSRLERDIDDGIGYKGTPEYLPNGSDPRVLSESKWEEAGIIAESSDVPANSAQSHDPNTFAVASAQPEQARLKRFDYPSWEADLDGNRVQTKLRDGEGHIVVAVPAGKHTIRISWQRQWDAKFGAAISIASAMSLLGLMVITRRKLSRATQRETESVRSFPAVALQSPALRADNEQSLRLKL